MNHPVEKKASAIFIPVRDIEKARDWYCGLLDVPVDGEIAFGHIYVIPLENIRVVLDSNIFEKYTPDEVPKFHFDTRDIKAAYEYIKSKP